MTKEFIDRLSEPKAAAELSDDALEAAAGGLLPKAAWTPTAPGRDASNCAGYEESTVQLDVPMIGDPGAAVKIKLCAFCRHFRRGGGENGLCAAGRS